MINFLAFNLQAFWKVWLVGGIGLFTVAVSAITDKYADCSGCIAWIGLIILTIELIILAIVLYAITH